MRFADNVLHRLPTEYDPNWWNEHRSITTDHFATLFESTQFQHQLFPEL